VPLKFLLAFQILYIVNQVHFNWETGIPGVAPTNLLFLVTLLAMRGKPDQIDTPGILKQPLLRFFVALGFAFLVAQVRQFDDLIADFTYLKNALFFPLLYFMYLRCRQDKKTTRLLIIWILVIAAMAGLEAFREGIDYGFGKYSPMRRASGPFGPDWHFANRAGVFYGMFFPMFVAVALFLRGQRLLRLAGVGGIVLLMGAAFSTYSRQAYILLILGGVLLLLRRSIALTVVLGTLMFSLVGYLPDSVTQRVEETKQEDSKGGGGEVDVSTASRWEIWGGALAMLMDHPIGVGLNRFKKEIGSYSSHKGMDAHNFYVLTLAETGAQGLIPFLLFIAALFRLARFLRDNASPDDTEARTLALGFTVMTFNMMLGGIYGSPYFEGSVMGPYWALCGLLERYTLLNAGGAEKQAAAPREPSIAERFPLMAHILPGRR
jgi:O-antigen ligase